MDNTKVVMLGDFNSRIPKAFAVTYVSTACSR